MDGHLLGCGLLLHETQHLLQDGLTTTQETASKQDATTQESISFSRVYAMLKPILTTF